MKNNNYVTPESELLIVRFEENFCNSPLGTVPQPETNDIEEEY